MNLRFVIPILLLASNQGYAAKQCKTAHSETSREAVTPLSEADGPTAAKAKKLGMRYDEGTKSLYGKLPGQNQESLLGTISIREQPYLYEWAERESSEAWIKRGGIEQWEMDLILNDGAQAAGRGYYVSTSPADSMSYGDAITFFRAHEKMVILKRNESYVDQLDEAPGSFMKKLATLGIDAIPVNGIRGTWFSMINPRMLSDASPLSGHLLDAFETKKGIEDLYNFAAESSSMKAGASERYANEIFAIAKKNKITASSYWAMANIYEPRYVAKLRKASKASASDLLKDMHEVSANYAKRRAQIDLKSIRSVQEFVDAVSYLAGTKVEFRSRPLELESSPGMENGFLKTLERCGESMKKNSFLTTVAAKDQSYSNYKINVSFPSAASYKRFESLLSPGLARKLKALPKNKVDSESGQRLTQEIVKDLLSGLFDSKRASSLALAAEGIFQPPVTPNLLFKVFNSIRPFDQSNGVAARLYREMLLLKSGASEGEREAVQPIRDLDLFFPETGTRGKFFIGSLLRTWIADSKNDQEFIDRNLQALRMMDKFSRWGEAFPDVRENAAKTK